MARRLRDVRYDLRGELLAAANRLEAEGRHVEKLNVGNMGLFGLHPPEPVLAMLGDVVSGNAEGIDRYSDSRGFLSVRRKLARSFADDGVRVDVDDIFLGNGVSELIQLSLQALLDDGDEVLVPEPDYPLWSACIELAGARPVRYRCAPEAGWDPDLGDIADKVTPRTVGIVIINPNNPTGAVYGDDVLRGVCDIAARHGLAILSDEIYESFRHDGTRHVPIAAVAGNRALCMTYGGLSKSFAACGFRAGWMAVTGVSCEHRELMEHVELLANMRMCPNTVAQSLIDRALDHEGRAPSVLASEMARRVDCVASAIGEIEGLACVRPDGALYCFVGYDREAFGFASDVDLCVRLLEEELILVTPGTGFNMSADGYFRIACLPPVEDLAPLMGRMRRFFDAHRT